MRKKLDTKTYQEKVNSLFGSNTYTLVSEYSGASENIQVTHSKCGNTFSVIANDFTKTAKYKRFLETCPKCRHSRALSEEDAYKRIDNLSKSRMKLLTYAGSTHAVSTLQCNICEYTTEISLHTFTSNIQGYKCPDKSWGCARCSGKKQKTTEEFSKEIDEIFKGSIVLVGKYVNVATHVSLKCSKCKGTWSTTPSSILRGSQCPICLRSYRDSTELRKIVSIFNSLNIEFEREVTFEGLRHKMQLYFDFCIEKDGNYFIIEFDGQQHFRGWQGCSENLTKNQIRDKIKDDFCRDYNIPLLRLNYKMTLGELEKTLIAFIDHNKLH